MFNIQLNGALDISGVDVFEETIAAMDLTSVTMVCVDMKNVVFIDSTGIGSLLNLIRTLKEQETEYKFININEEIQEIFLIIGLEDLLASR